MEGKEEKVDAGFKGEIGGGRSSNLKTRGFGFVSKVLMDPRSTIEKA